MVEVLGLLIREVASGTDDEQEAREKRLNDLFEYVIERFLDVSSYVRAKVISTLTKLLDLPIKFPKQRLIITENAVGSLEDKGSSVRRYAIALLQRLILTHPYGLMHGGLLKLEEWEERYESICKELQDVDKEPVDQVAEEEEDEEDEDDEDDEETDGEGLTRPSETDNDENDIEQTPRTSPMKAARKRMQ